MSVAIPLTGSFEEIHIPETNRPDTLGVLILAPIKERRPHFTCRSSSLNSIRVGLRRNITMKKISTVKNRL